jgi:hypothetical protein
MKFLYIGSGDVFSRHELGFMAALSVLGNVDVITLGSKANVEKMKVGSDNDIWNVTFHYIPCRNMFVYLSARLRLSNLDLLAILLSEIAR